MENFWSTLKIELVYRTSWRTRDEAVNAIFAYIDGWYNTRRAELPQPERVRDRLAQPPGATSRTTYRRPCASRQQVTTAPSKRGEFRAGSAKLFVQSPS
ncbi:hypothetical protein CSH63_21415 [Micromonospora tulbaghiae]|uniref:Integrase catalytic domain-containing protein n=1 Tax=Micromonospora tulbaghiae TaxID=479978 RepID=A0A386WU41_9ACTN|nr:hypothetical protein CSH63_21415 [Micromonospora tulbaghiae]